MPQPLWSCRTAIKITNNIVPNLKQATIKRLREQFAEGESDWSLRAVSPRLRGLRFFSKGVQSRIKKSFIRTQDYNFDNTFNML